MQDPMQRQDRKVVRTKQPAPDYVPEHREPRRTERRTSRRAELAAALDEWAADYENTHSVFED